MHVGRVKAKLAPNCGADIPDFMAKQIMDYIEGVSEEAKPKLKEVLLQPTFVKAKIIGSGRNRHALIGIPGKGRFPALMPTSDNLPAVGKVMEFEEVEYQGKFYYRHKSLANMTFREIHTRI